MGIGDSVILAVLKSIVRDKLGSGLKEDVANILIDEVSEKGIDKINGFINGGKNKIENIFSEESMKSMNITEEKIEYIVSEIKDLLSRIDITDDILRQSKYNNLNLGAFLWDVYCKDKSDYIESESEIKQCLFVVAEVLIELVRESKNFEKDFLIQISNSADDIKSEMQTNSQNMMKRFDRIEESTQVILDKVSKESDLQNENIEQKKIKSRTLEYANRWNQNMFLNDFDKRDENAGVNVKLREVYLEEHLPYYIWKNNSKPDLEHELKELLYEYIIENDYKKMLLILGQPGIGKSTLITWIVANYSDIIDDILVYQFASDLKNVRWQNIGENYEIVDEILKELRLSYEDLEGKTLILDGFDEISAGNNRVTILNQVYWGLIKESSLKNFSLIVTCRENYIQNLYRIDCVYITLQAWNNEQIRSFCKIYWRKIGCNFSENVINSVIENKEILGIPLILYMVLALNISIEKKDSIVDVYDQIFSLEGGIYDRCINYNRYEKSHRINEIKKQIHQISREIAIWMFENDSEDACISQEEYQKICVSVMQQSKQKNEKEGKKINQDFLIGNFFKLVKHCEGIETEKLYFVHRSIYEYFVAETIYNSIENALLSLTVESQEELAGNIAIYLKKGEITYTIGLYLKSKIIKLFSKLEDEKKKRFYQWWEDTVGKMLDVGMFYYTKRNIQDYKHIIQKEIQCFINLIEILRLLLETSKKRYIMESITGEQIERYINYCCAEYRYDRKDKRRVVDLSKMFLRKIDLNGINLRGADLSRTYLREAELREADLSGANLKMMNLSGVNMNGADLRGADLRGINLREVDLREADLSGADLKETELGALYLSGTIFDEKQIKYLEQKYSLQGTRVYINETNEIISYEGYCNRKN